MVKLSIVILCWNDLKVIPACLESIYAGTRETSFEVIMSDNGSTDGSIEFVHANFPAVQVIENGVNLRFSKGNNIGIRVSKGEYILILNPDTIIHDGALDRWVSVADGHPEAGAFGCRILNPDGSYQGSARPFPTLVGSLVGALYLRWLGQIFDLIPSDTYTKWQGDTERAIDWQAGCAVMLRANLLKELGGFDEQFFYYYEDVDLCHRVWKAGYPILYTPTVIITHLGGQSTQRDAQAFEVDKYRNRYRYFYKYYGTAGVRRCRAVTLTSLILRYVGYSMLQMVRPGHESRVDLCRTAIKWNMQVDPARLVRYGDDPNTALGGGLRCS